MSCSRSKYPAALPFRPQEIGLGVAAGDEREQVAAPLGSYHRLTYGIPVEAARCSKPTREPQAGGNGHSKVNKTGGFPSRQCRQPRHRDGVSADRQKRTATAMTGSLLLHPSFAQFNKGAYGNAETSPTAQKRRGHSRTHPQAAGDSYSLYDLLTVPVIGQVATLSGDRLHYRASNHHNHSNSNHSNSGSRQRSEETRDFVREQVHQSWSQNQAARPRRVVVASPSSSLETTPLPSSGSGSKNGPFSLFKLLSAKDGDGSGKSSKRAKAPEQPLETFKHDELCACGGFRSATATGGDGGADFSLAPFCIVRARTQQQRRRLATDSSPLSETNGVFSTTDFPTDRNGAGVRCVCACHRDSWFQTRQCAVCDCYKDGCDQQ